MIQYPVTTLKATSSWRISPGAVGSIGLWTAFHRSPAVPLLSGPI
jgi:hypothetical protein